MRTDIRKKEKFEKTMKFVERMKKVQKKARKKFQKRRILREVYSKNVIWIGQ